MYSLYSILLLLALVFSTPWWLLQMWRHGKYRSGWRERLGDVPHRLLPRVAKEPILSPRAGAKDGAPETIWVHAVSVGEVLAMTQVIARLQAGMPRAHIVVSTTTDTGQNLARQRFGEDHVFRLPLDLPFAVRPYFDALRPKLLVLAESEFWPNLVRWARRSGAAVAVANARVSDRSFPGYFRFRGLLQPMMKDIDLFLAQSEEDARRLVCIGAPTERVHVSGNLKFEIKTPARSHIGAAVAEAVQRTGGPVIVAGSTLEGEEALLLEMFRQVRSRYSGPLMVLAPRHPERFEKVANLLSSSLVPFQRGSSWDGRSAIAPGVLLLDSIGELAGLYEFATLAFVGGSLVPRGGHNVVEAAQFGKAILVGPYTNNFRDVVELFRRSDALRVVNPQELTQTVLQLLENNDDRTALGERALEVMRTQQGATERTVRALVRLLQVEVAAPEVASESRA